MLSHANLNFHPSGGVMSRVILDLRKELISKAKRLTGLTTNTEIVNYVLTHLIRQKNIEQVTFLRRKVTFKKKVQTDPDFYDRTCGILKGGNLGKLLRASRKEEQKHENSKFRK